MQSSLKRFHVKTRAKAFNLHAEAVWIGSDLLVYVWGGEKPHIGSVAAAQPRPSLKDKAVTSATASVLTYPGHKEDTFAKKTAESLASALKTRVVATAGMHWDNLDDSDIRLVLSNGRRLIRMLTKMLLAEDPIS
jgi:hypothetical protein